MEKLSGTGPWGCTPQRRSTTYFKNLRLMACPFVAALPPKADISFLGRPDARPRAEIHSELVNRSGNLLILRCHAGGVRRLFDRWPHNPR